MNSQKLSIILSFLLCFTISTEAQATYLAHECSNTTLTGNSNYLTNLNLLLSILSSNSNNSFGFYNNSAGQDPDHVNGLFLCRGDISTDVCKNCVTFATQDIVKRCPIDKEALVWYDECLLRYSNRTFFSTMDQYPWRYMWDDGRNITDQVRFNSLLVNALTDATAEAANAPSGAKKFATLEANFTVFQTLYNLVQCTPDISRSDCSQCLQKAISYLPDCCSGKQGVRILLASCNLRYALSRFYSDTGVEGSPISPVPDFNSLPPTSTETRSQGKDISTVIIVSIVTPIAVFVVLFCLVCCFFVRRRARKKYKTVKKHDAGNEIATESLQMDMDVIEAATNNFSAHNKLGEGGFGEVYKGTLLNGQEIAVKKLSRDSGQGAKEFKNEVVLLAKLQHRNLVRLIGFCLEGEEKILVYEFVTNKSLDCLLFDPKKKGNLDWSRRYKIIGGIARGILYLHEDSRLRIIHRDLKASNILLDSDMNPRLSDFGLAKLFEIDQTQGNTTRIAGTFGYMSPEYALHGQFSIKSDIYSFGVLVLEIICGKKNSSFYQTDGECDLMIYAWRHWRAGTPIEVLDPILKDAYKRNEVLRCIQIGLLCVQEDPNVRPTMATVLLMLNSLSDTLPVPQQPALCPRSEPSMPMNGLESDKSTRMSGPAFVNECNSWN